jgi:hypothetical protein
MPLEVLWQPVSAERPDRHSLSIAAQSRLSFADGSRV